MKPLEFYIVDVFAEKKYAGNQLAVFRNARRLSTEQMQNIARETNFSETTFIDYDDMRSGGFDVRIFTPAAEIPFAGHPTLGTAFIIKEKIIQKNVDRIALNLKVGQIPVELRYANGHLDVLWMKQMNPTFGKCLAVDEVASILNLEPEAFDTRFPIEEVSTGIPFFMVPLKSLPAVQNITVNLEKYYEFVRRHHPNIDRADVDEVVSAGFFVFCPEAVEPENHVHARMFDDYYGVPEDPATGSANGCFLGYLLKHRYFDKTELDLRVEQGYEINRPSLLFLKGKARAENQFDILVGGRVQLIAKGEWYV